MLLYDFGSQSSFELVAMRKLSPYFIILCLSVMLSFSVVFAQDKAGPASADTAQLLVQAQKLLEEEHTVVTDGAGFGAEGFVRISYATSMEQIQEGVARIKRFVERHV